MINDSSESESQLVVTDGWLCSVCFFPVDLRHKTKKEWIEEVIVSGLMVFLRYKVGMNASPDCPSMSGWSGLVWLLHILG